MLKHQKRDLRAELVVELIGRALFHQGDGVGEGQLVQAPVGFGGDFDGRIGDRQKPPGGWVGRQHFIQEGGGEPLKRAPQHNKTIARRHQKSGCRGKRRVVVVQPGGIGAVVEKAVIDGDRKPQSGTGVFGNEGVDRVMVIKALGMVARELMALVFCLGKTQTVAGKLFSAAGTKAAECVRSSRSIEGVDGLD